MTFHPSFYSNIAFPCFLALGFSAAAAAVYSRKQASILI